VEDPNEIALGVVCIGCQDIGSLRPDEGRPSQDFEGGYCLGGPSLRLFSRSRSEAQHLPPEYRTELPRVCRRLFGLSHAAMAGRSSIA
jgi:hypothetical protein